MGLEERDVDPEIPVSWQWSVRPRNLAALVVESSFLIPQMPLNPD